MTSKAKRRLNKKRRAQGKQAPQAPNTHEKPRMASGAYQTARPTPERLKQGTWAAPQGMGKDMQPMVDLASDMIGALYQAKQITTSQEQAARLFQELRAGYLAELGTKGFGSCLADNQQGYDAGDGNAAAIIAYRALEDKIGRIKTACLILECDRGPAERPVNLAVLTRALDVVAM